MKAVQLLRRDSRYVSWVSSLPTGIPKQKTTINTGTKLCELLN